jgi:tetratricopeptide (TPR) repeat protein
MKINPDTTEISDQIAVNDMEFWDWYWRRLLRDDAFRRDFPAQKAFSKLRAAIAGLYLKQGRFNLGAKAYREACHLYPASPEASFRYCQEVLLGSRKWDQIVDILDYTDRVDPNNKRTAPFRDYVTRVHAMTTQIAALQREQIELRKKNLPFPPEKQLMLARALYETGQNQLAAFNAKDAVKDEKTSDFSILFGAARILSLCGQRADAVNVMMRAKAVMPRQLDGAIVREIGAVLAEGGHTTEAVQVYTDHLRANPADADAWLQLAILQHASGQLPAAENSILMAIQYNQPRAVEIINANTVLMSIADPLFRRLRAQHEQRMANPFGPMR